MIRSGHPDNHRFAFCAILHAEDDRRTIVWYLAVASCSPTVPSIVALSDVPGPLITFFNALAGQPRLRGK